MGCEYENGLVAYRVLAKELDTLAGNSKVAHFVGQELIGKTDTDPSAPHLGNFVSDLKLSQASDAINELVGYIIIREKRRDEEEGYL